MSSVFLIYLLHPSLQSVLLLCLVWVLQSISSLYCIAIFLIIFWWFFLKYQSFVSISLVTDPWVNISRNLCSALSYIYFQARFRLCNRSKLYESKSVISRFFHFFGLKQYISDRTAVHFAEKRHGIFPIFIRYFSRLKRDKHVFLTFLLLDNCAFIFHQQFTIWHEAFLNVSCSCCLVISFDTVIRFSVYSVHLI